ncbi:CHRD domain-containing protein [Flavobacterium ranwuense]|uniref:CHRD domain-containing protein n=1 Tax=Flavobacterium ranwuense TaxID=2541725 RepID=A0ABY2DQU3_9FLAO|nr:CHRD domain-containing protein [Flavobacterium ranwuense]TDE28542.1 CHRD domain-containing protein [Flavobacterium ranwuense]
MKHLFRFLAIPFFLLGIASCDNNNDNPGPSLTTFNATLNGTSEVPSNASTATGTATLTFNNTTKTFTITVTYSGVTATGGHIHKGAVGVSGDIVFPFTSLTSPITYTSVALTAAQEADLKANLHYVNIHSAAYPGGEIRGQLIKGTTSGGGGGGY